MAALLYLAFFISGMAGLVYETIWGRYLALLVGHGAYAQVVVLAVFLGGLAIGSIWVGRRSERIRRPLRTYAIVEIAVGVYGLLFHPLFVAVRAGAEGTLFPLLGPGAPLTALRWILASLLILLPSVLLGTTFPLITAGFLRIRPEAPGRLLAVFYFLNSFGAALGALLAGFVLVGVFGLPGTLQTAAALSILAGLLAWRVSVGIETPEAAPVPVPVAGPTGGGPVAEAGDPWRLLLGVAFGTAVASFIYEIAWIRMLSLVLGAATHAFELMLSAFILGLAIGAWIIRTRADRLPDPVRTLAWIQWGMGAAAILTLPVYLASFRFTEILLAALQPTDGGYLLFNLTRYGLALAVMLPATTLAGMTLPLISLVLLRGPRGERAVGWVYGINTLGSIVGVSVAALVLLPMIGLKALLILGAVLDMLLGVWLLRHQRRGPRDGAVGDRPALALTAALVAVVVLASPFELAVLGSGVFRTGSAAPAQEVVFWEDGRTASVAVLDYANSRILATNGKPDASLSQRWLGRDTLSGTGPLAFDESTQALLSLITLAHHPQARRALVIGQGSGMSSHFLLGSPALEEVITAEIEPAMIEGSRAFRPHNDRVFDDPRSRFVLSDARAFMAADDARFDLILSEPSNPWVSGVSALFTREFYGAASARLAEGGIFAQWLQIYEISDDLVLSVLAALDGAFGDFRAFRVHPGDLLIVATNADRLPAPDWTVFELPLIAEDLSLTFPFDPGYLDRMGFLSEDALRPLLDRGIRANSDFDPLLDFEAEKTRYLRATAAGTAAMSRSVFDPAEFFEPLRPELGVDGPNPIPSVDALNDLELASRLAADAAPPEGVGLAEAWGEARFRETTLQAIVESELPPTDWVRWLRLALDVEAARAGGRTGWVDEAFFDWALDYATRLEAPAAVPAALRFRRAARLQDLAAVADELRFLGPTFRGPQPWIEPEVLMDVGVLALISTGDVAGARRLFEGLWPAVLRGPDDLRSQLVFAWLDAADQGWRGPVR